MSDLRVLVIIPAHNEEESLPGTLDEVRAQAPDVDVLVVDDILDTGRTLSRVLGRLRELKPRRIRTCVLLDKKDPNLARQNPADYAAAPGSNP